MAQGRWEGQGRWAAWGVAWDGADDANDRSGTWADEAQEGEWAGLEEPFAIMHKTALHELYTERERDTQQNPKPRHTAMQIYQHVQAKVQRIVENLWALALARRRSDQGSAR